jgi:hypothetical protein
MSEPRLPPGKISARLRFTPTLRELLATIVGHVHAAQAAAPDEFPAPTPDPAAPPDPDLQAAWAEGLRERVDHDTKALSDLVTDPRFGLADLPLSPSAAEAVARACTHVRLHLRETLLRDLTAAESEGSVDVFGLRPAEQQGYACFRLLAHLEEDLLLQLDPDLAQG